MAQVYDQVFDTIRYAENCIEDWNRLVQGMASPGLLTSWKDH